MRIRMLLTGSLITFALSGGAFAQDGLPLPAEGGVPELAEREAQREIQRTLDLAQEQVTKGAQQAYEQWDFNRRNQLAAEKIAAETTIMAAIKAQATPEQALRMQRVFEAATATAGAEFKEAFDREGRGIPERKSVIGEAANRSGSIALSAMGPLVEAIDPSKAGQGQTYAEGVVRNTRVEDVAKLVAKDLGLRNMPLHGADLVRTVLQLVPEGNWARADAEALNQHLRGNGERPLREQGLKTLRLGTQLANSTYKGAQPQRARYEESPKRIQRSAFQNFDRHIENVFHSTKNEHIKENMERGAYTPPPTHEVREEAVRRGFAMAVFEVWKDVAELKKGLDRYAVAPETARRDREHVRREIARVEMRELYRLSLPELLREAKRRGVQVNATMDKPTIAARIMGVTATEAWRTFADSAPKSNVESVRGFAQLLRKLNPQTRRASTRRGRR